MKYSFEDRLDLRDPARDLVRDPARDHKYLIMRDINIFTPGDLDGVKTMIPLILGSLRSREGQGSAMTFPVGARPRPVSVGMKSCCTSGMFKHGIHAANHGRRAVPWTVLQKDSWRRSDHFKGYIPA